MPALTVAEFPAFFAAVHGGNDPGFAPFPWQIELCRVVLEQGWPRTLALPTASGKTAVIDIAVFALAAQAHLPATTRSAARRIALVVDRRIVVDDAFRRAQRIAAALAVRDPLPVVARVAEALRALGGDPQRPLDTALLRGGIYREDRWAKTPLQPVVLCSTVDQVGSRLLHRGYGLSPGMWPIHAGLLAHDSLIILDEAHVSGPFLQTLEAVRAFQRQAERPLPGGLTVTAMTATPRQEEVPFTLTPEDRAHPLLQQRLVARKPASLVTAAAGETGFQTALAKAVRGHLAPGRTVLAVVNRVATARALWRALASAATRERLDADVILLTGRARPVERDALLAAWRAPGADRLMAGRDRTNTATAKPLIIISTQCIEVGADLDIDALVSEAAPLDALRQRFGRLDRLGQLGESPATLVCRGDLVPQPGKELAEDPIYGKALAATWRWLAGHAVADVIDFGIDALGRLLPADPAVRSATLAALAAPAVDAPIMLPAYLDLWVQTGPVPAVSPDPAIFLHGPQRGTPEVQVIWRGDLGPDPSLWAEVVALCPPISGEAIALPLHQVRAWLDRRSTVNLADPGDLDGAPRNPESDRSEPDGTEPPRPALRWAGPETDATRPIAPADLRPGDTIVVPCTHGGCDRFGWDPESPTLVMDCTEAARVQARKPAILRLQGDLVAAWVDLATGRDKLLALTTWRAAEAWPDEAPTLARDALATLAIPDEPLPAIGTTIRTILADQRFVIVPHPAGGVVMSSQERLGESDFTSEDLTSSQVRRGYVTLSQHLADVGGLGREFTQSLLPSERTLDVALAGDLHDLGKADPRFQILLAGGDRLRARRLQRKHGLLAKSARMPGSKAEADAARKQAGYPVGGRHELLSLALVESDPALLAACADPDLVRHLIVSHHGHCRPFAPVVFDEHPTDVTVTHAGSLLRASTATGFAQLDSGVAERFWLLVRRYGWWGLSYLEACLRLADHRASECPGATVEDA